MQSYRKNRRVWSVVSALLVATWASSAFSVVWAGFPPVDAAPIPKVHTESVSSASLVDKHARVCHCAVCPGIKRCCCLAPAATTTQEQMLLTARCGDEIPARVAAAFTSKIMFPTGAVLPVIFSVPALVTFPPSLQSNLAFRSLLPLLPPPRLS